MNGSPCSEGGRRLAASPLRASGALLRWLGFWAAVLLPLVHVPLLFTTGFTAAATPIILSLWTANGLALLLGQNHTPRGERGDASGPR